MFTRKWNKSIGAYLGSKNHDFQLGKDERIVHLHPNWRYSSLYSHTLMFCDHLIARYNLPSHCPKEMVIYMWFGYQQQYLSSTLSWANLSKVFNKDSCHTNMPLVRIKCIVNSIGKGRDSNKDWTCREGNLTSSWAYIHWKGDFDTRGQLLERGYTWPFWKWEYFWKHYNRTP